MNNSGARQQEAPTWSGNSGEGTDNHLTAGVTDNSTRLPHQDILDELEDRAIVWLVGWDQGYAAGRNDRRTDAEAVTLHQAAAEIVTRMAGYPERDRDADRAAADRRAARFGQPRFGGAA